MKMSSDGECRYSLSHYVEILRAAKERYWLPKVRDVAFGLPDEDFLLIRHDVDINPWAAFTMAELEQREGVETTYYYRLHAPYYNLLDGRVLDLVLRVAEMGHEIGLHHEPGFFLERGLDPVQGVRRDIQTFEDLVGFRTRTIAQHQPAQGPLLDEICPDHPCAYQRDLVVRIPYYGDSGFRWREGCICTKFDKPQVHTLIHPHSWVIDDRPWQDVLRAQTHDLAERLDGEMERYITSVEEYLENRARIDRERAERYGGSPG